MAYAEKVPSPNGDYWRGRYKDQDGRYVTVRDEHGQAMRFGKKQDAKNAAADRESAVRTKRGASAQMLFGEWAGIWYNSLSLAETTMETYKSHLELHILPRFETEPLDRILGIHVDAWANKLREEYSAASVGSYRGTLSACLADAVPALIPFNPAARKRGKGRRSGKRHQDQAPEKVITGPLGMLLIAERISILTGRDDEFVMTQAMYGCALRIGETIGLERRCVRPSALSVEWQLTGVGGKLVRCPPKDDSYGDLDLPPYLAALLAGHMAAVPASPCPCHGHVYAFRGFGSPGGRGPVSLRVLAAAARVSVTTAAAVMAGAGRIRESTRERVLEAARETGYVQPGPGSPSAHWHRSTFEELFSAAASGRLPARDGLPERPVPVAGEWPGTRVRGRNCEGRSHLCWLPVAAGMTPHGTRHSAKTLMEERRIPEIASEKRLRHSVAGISGRYRHVTPAMREEITAMLEQAWLEALDARLEMSPWSPVAVLGRLLKDRAQARKPRLVTRDSPESRSLTAVNRTRTIAELALCSRKCSTAHIRK